MTKTRRKRKKGRIFLGIVAFLAIAVLCLYFSKDALLKKVYPLPYYEIVMTEAEKNGLNPALVYGVIRAESGFDPNAVSHANARGLMQMTPQTFEWVQTMIPDSEHLTAEDLFDPEVNIRFGCELLSLLISHYDNESTAICAYNAGMGNVTSWLENPEYSSDGTTLNVIPFGETQEYLKRVIANRDMYLRLYAQELVQS
ncbi:MAG TPA: lytic transglycosylase domain-containing protein [Candidatus Gallacutalibacter pullistercoris]|nr:lytic transglycosylase domain-containing protein [Candidatus Gallacutalibacter pullistercoris]